MSDRQESEHPDFEPDTIKSRGGGEHTEARPPPDTAPLSRPAGSRPTDNPPASPGPSEETTLYQPAAESFQADGLDSAWLNDSVPTLPQPPRMGKRKASSPEAVRTFGDYELLQPIARGGMGVVFKARQKKLNRIVALKMILVGNLATQEEVQRFYTEAEAAGQLDHPGIVPVYEVGEHEGQHYFSMAFVDGDSLAARVQTGPLPPREAAELVRQVAEAIAYAHQRGIIHRDLKPGNILVGSDGHPKITDFGLAKRVQGASNLTVAGQILGTPSYMPPEQAAGKTEEVGPAADIYSAGAVLYCLITGRPPFQSAQSVETLKQVLEQEPVSPRQLNTAVSRDLETICLKCLQKDPGKRYATATALADDLRRYLTGLPILARPVGRAERMWRWCRRNPAIAASLAGIFLSLLVGTVVAWVLAIEAQRGRRNAEAATQRADQKADESRRRWYDAEINLAQRDWNAAQIDLMLKRLDLLAQHDQETPDLRGFEWYYLQRQSRLDLRTLSDHSTAVRCVAFSPDGRLLVTGSGEFGNTGQVVIWESATGQKLRTMDADAGPVWSVAFSPDGRKLAAASGNWRKSGEVKVWDTATWEPCPAPGRVSVPVSGVAFSPDGRWIAGATGGIDQSGHAIPSDVKIWDAATGKETQSLSGHQALALSVAFSPDGRWLASGGHDNSVRVWDLSNGNKALTLSGHRGFVTSVAFSADSRRLASGSWDQTVRIWDTTEWIAPPRPGEEKRSATPLLTLQHGGEVHGVTFSGPGGERLVVGSTDHFVKVWDTASARETLTLRGHLGAVHGVAFSADGRRVASASNDRTAKIWDAHTDQESTSLVGHRNIIHQLAFNRVDGRLASASDDRTIRLWDATMKREIAALQGHTKDVWGVAFSDNGQLLASGSEDSTVRVWNMAHLGSAPCPEPLVLRGHAAGVWGVAFSPTAPRLASASFDGTVKMWDLPSGNVRFTAVGHNRPVWAVAFSPDGQTLVSAGEEDTLRFWDADTGEEKFTLRGHPGGTIALSFSPDGRLLATGGKDQAVRVWDLATRRETMVVAGQPAWVWTVAFSPDGQRLAAAAANQMKIWDVATAQEIFVLRGLPTQEIFSVAFSPNGRELVAAGHQKNSLVQAVTVWDATPLTPELLDEREARSVVAYWFSKAQSAEAVSARIRSDPSLSETVRQQALDMVGFYAGPGPH